jgi:hypothetical protein
VRLSAWIVTVAWFVGAASVAHAYPQFQLSHESTCSACHLSPAGGGLINNYGRDEAGATLSRGGDGRLLHGLWDPPEWFAIGGDFRFANVARRVPVRQAGEQANRDDLLIFPMQADMYLRFMTGNFAVAVTAGLRGQSQEPDLEQPLYVERLWSREHYASYAIGENQVRVGRFFPVFGLRLPDHTAYVRRFMGWNLNEEPYAAEFAHYGDKTEIHATAFVPPPPILGSGLRPKGASVHVERRVGDNTIAGAQARVGVGEGDVRYTIGGVGKWFMPEAKVLWLAELDLQRQTFRGSGPGRTQLASYFGASKWATRGVLVSGAVHVWESDLTLERTMRGAFELGVQYFAWAHVELHLVGRASAQGGNVEDPAYRALLQLHYYL